MDWTLVKSKLLDEIYLGCKFDKNSEIRKVLETPESENGEFKIKISKTGASIKISMEMLKKVFEATRENKNKYNKGVLYDLYPKEVDTHSCYVHTVGQLFEYIGVMNKEDKRNFAIIK